MDFVTGFPESSPSQEEQYDSVLVVVDMFTKYAYVLPFWKTGTAAETATLLFNSVTSHQGFLQKIISDRDPRFVSEFWQSL